MASGSRPSRSWQRHPELIQLAHSTDPNQGFRTNLGFVNLNDQELDLRVSLYSRDGTHLRNRSFHLGPCEHTQENNIFRNLAVSLDSAFAEVTSTTPGSSYFVYASVIDNQTGDPMYVAGEPLLPPPSAGPGSLRSSTGRVTLW
jgi:hypothetical protein